MRGSDKTMLKNTDIIILAGGLGKRLQSVTGGGQKVLAAIDGKPFIAILIEYIASQGGQRFIVCTGHGAESVEQRLRGMFAGLTIKFSREQEPLGTGGAIKKGAGLVTSDIFLAMNGDCFCAMEYDGLIAAHQQHGADATVAVTRMDDARDYGTIEIDADNGIVAFREKLLNARQALINTGTYCFKRDVFSLAATVDKFSMEYDFFPQLVGKKFYAHQVGNRFIDIGTPNRYAWAQEHLKSWGTRGK